MQYYVNRRDDAIRTLEERDVTRLLKNFLEKKNWEILSVHYPGSQAGVFIVLNEKPRRTIVPDIIAMKGNTILIVECKLKFSKQDVKKLNEVFKDSNNLTKISKKLGIKRSIEISFQKALAFHNKRNFDIKKLSDFIVFIINFDKVVTYYGDKINEQVRKLFDII